jgi:hypothetical protein
MRKLEKNTRRYFVNLFADFILSKSEKTENTIIQVTDCENFVIVNGQTTSKTVLDLGSIKQEFCDSFGDLLKSLNMEDINILDIIRYDQEIPPYQKSLVSVNKNLYVEEYEPVIELSVTSEFPYGHSLNCGRSILYYSHYMFNHMYSLLGVNELHFKYTTKLDENEDYKINIISESRIPKENIVSLVLDVFNMDLTEFTERMMVYNLIDDILDPSLDKPYLVQDRLKDVILL